MESVIYKIKEARADELKRKTTVSSTEIFVDGCSVKLHFDESGDNRIMQSIQSMLIAAYLETALTKQAGGECA
jgi:hypothetical protein